MVIACPGRMADVIHKAIQMDRMHLSAIIAEKGSADIDDLHDVDACSSLMQCLAARMMCDEAANSRLAYNPVPSNYRQETFVFEDFIKDSFTFREFWVENGTHEDAAPTREVWKATLGDEEKTLYSKEDADKAENEGYVVKPHRVAVVGMFGGIVFHAKWKDGKQLPWGSWSTHT